MERPIMETTEIRSSSNVSTLLLSSTTTIRAPSNVMTTTTTNPENAVSKSIHSNIRRHENGPKDHVNSIVSVVAEKIPTTSTTVPQSTTLPQPPMMMKRKRISPFRIKTGCIVACRINHQLFSPNVSLQSDATTTTNATIDATKRCSSKTLPSTEIIDPPDPSLLLSPPSLPVLLTTSASTISPTTTANGEHPENHVSPSESSSRPATNTSTTAQIIQYRDDTYRMVWTNPIRHRDCYWSLIGKRIRCCYVIPETQRRMISSSTSTTAIPKKMTFDGEVIRLFPYHPTNGNNNNKNDNNNAARCPPPRGQHDIELLMDATMVTKLPFLQPSIIETSSTAPNNIERLSKKERRTLELEQHVARGVCGSNRHNTLDTTNHTIHPKSLISVRITLHCPNDLDDVDTTKLEPDTMPPTAEKKKNDVETLPSHSRVVIRKWVIQKCVPISFGGETKRIHHTTTTTSSTTKRKYPPKSAVSNSNECHTNTNIITTATNINNNNNITSSSSIHGISPNKRNESKITTLTTMGDSNNEIIKSTNHNGNGTSSDDKDSNGKVGMKRVASNNVNGLGDSQKDKKLKHDRNNVNQNDKNSKNVKITTTPAANSSGATINHPRIKSNAQPQYIGDGNDSAEQQEHNWRFIASRYHDLLYKSLVPWSPGHPTAVPQSTTTTAHLRADVLSGGWIGEVMKVDPNAAPSITLAMVTIRRMILPEHTFTGRCTSWHHRNDIFTDYDSIHNPCLSDVTITVPIEQLVVVSRNVDHSNTADDVAESNNPDAVIRYSYSWADNVYIPPTYERRPSGENDATNGNHNSDRIYCHKCRRMSSDPTTIMIVCDSIYCPLSPKVDRNTNTASEGTSPLIAWCKGCINICSSSSNGKVGLSLPCCENQCDCETCTVNRTVDLQQRLYSGILQRTKKICVETQSDDKFSMYDCLSFSASILRSMGEVSSYSNSSINFFTLPMPQRKPKTRIVQRTIRSGKSYTMKSTSVASRAMITSDKPKSRKRTAVREGDIASVDVALRNGAHKSPLLLKKNHCAREIVYNASKKYSFQSWIGEDRNNALLMIEKPRSLRTVQDSSTRLITEQKDEVAKASSSNRAARASQRRLLRDVASLGITAPSYLGLVDTLANREPQLRFDRSSIHAWGVFADTAISAGEMIVEYRGELIGNAVAELREKEYESAKIGSDYMFRIDSLNVCDATKQGNVARFINASCDPNCYTKIITFDGLKRIVIYAKKDIQAGEELCYDYKFPIEYDKAKRIRCHCGARDCRGYMNWDKKYAALQLGHNVQLRSLISEHKPMKFASEEG